MSTRRKGRAEEVSKMIANMVINGMNGLSLEEKEKRINAFCDEASERLRKRSSACGSSRPVGARMAARGRV